MDTTNKRPIEVRVGMGVYWVDLSHSADGSQWLAEWDGKSFTAATSYDAIAEAKRQIKAAS